MKNNVLLLFSCMIFLVCVLIVVNLLSSSFLALYLCVSLVPSHLPIFTWTMSPGLKSFDAFL